MTAATVCSWVEGQLVEMSRGEPHARPDTVLDSDPDTLSRVLGADRAPTKALKDERLTITDDRVVLGDQIDQVHVQVGKRLAERFDPASRRRLAECRG